jgi:cAMP-dependent protein kinase regulator
MGTGASSKYKAKEERTEDCDLMLIEALSRVPLFNKLPASNHALVAAALLPSEFKAGDVVMKQGEIGKEMFLIRTGEAIVTVSNDGEPPHQVATLIAGSFFGEKALLHDVPQTATISAGTQLQTYKLSQKNFNDLGLKANVSSLKRKAIRGTMSAKSAPVPEPTPKTPEEEKFIIEALRKNDKLTKVVTLDDEQVKAMADACWKEEVNKGIDVITEGDVRADYFYIINSGSFDVLKAVEDYGRKGSKSTEATAKKEPVMKKVYEAAAGFSFGELALLCLMPRSATVRATEQSTVWVFDRKTFKQILMKSSDAKVDQYAAYLDEISVLNMLGPGERRMVAEAMVEVHYSKDDLIMVQGQLGNSVVLLIEGEVAVIKDGKEVERASVKDVSKAPPKVFGEKSFADTDEAREETVKCISQQVRVLAIDRDTFDIVLDTPEDVMCSKLSVPSQSFGMGMQRQR